MGSGGKVTNGEAENAKWKGDTKGDKKKIPVRPLTTEARDCMRLYKKKAKAEGKRPSMAAICRDYAETNGGSVDSIYRTLKSHSAKWKGDTKGDKLL